MKKLLLLLALILLASPVWADDVTLSWEAVTGANGYRIYSSLDKGDSWDAGQDVGNVTVFVMTSQPEHGMILYRVSAYSANGETIRTWSGAWYNGDWKPPESPSGAGIK